MTWSEPPSTSFRETLEEAKIEQKLRKREGGVTTEDLLKPVFKRNQSPVAEEDPYKLKTGGLVEMKKWVALLLLLVLWTPHIGSHPDPVA